MAARLAGSCSQEPETAFGFGGGDGAGSRRCVPIVSRGCLQAWEKEKATGKLIR